MKKKIFSAVLTVLILVVSFASVATAAPETVSSAVVLTDAASGRILYEKNGDQQMFPASTTKIMTAVLILENVDLSETATASYDAVFSIPVGGSNIGIIQGEQLTVEQLLYGALVASANEACNILAEHMSGDIDTFVGQMNAKAKELGMNNTHYVNTHGLHDEAHYTTAHDMAILARHAMQNETFRKIVSTKTYYIEPTEKYPQQRILSNTNNLLHSTSRYYYTNATGIKTGYTSSAGNCLVSAAQTDNAELICVTLGANYHQDGIYSFIDSKTLFKYGFENFKNKSLCKTGDVLAEVKVKHARGTDHVTAIAQSDTKALLPKDVSISEIRQEIHTQEGLIAPVAKHAVIGTVNYYYNDELVGTANLIADTEIKKDHWSAFLSGVGAFFTHPLVLIPIILVIVAFLVLVIMARVKTKKRRRYLKRKRYRNTNTTTRHRR